MTHSGHRLDIGGGIGLWRLRTVVLMAMKNDVFDFNFDFLVFACRFDLSRDHRKCRVRSGAVFSSSKCGERITSDRRRTSRKTSASEKCDTDKEGRTDCLERIASDLGRASRKTSTSESG